MQLKFRNNTYNEISDLSFSYVCYDSFGDVLQAGASTDYTMHNISGAPLQFFGDQIPILLSDSNTRSVKITFKKLLYSNGNIQNLDSFIACDVPVQKAMSKEEIKRLGISMNEFSSDVMNKIKEECNYKEFGARHVSKVLKNYLNNSINVN